MSAPMKFDLDGAVPLDKETATPADLALTVRDLRFCREEKPARWWLNGDPIATAWHNALSVAFPRGEALFIESVKAHREGVPPKLDAEIRAFIRQEANHTREHVAFNRAAIDAGYDLSVLEATVEARLNFARQRPAILNLAATMALEHLTALMSRETLANPDNMAGATGEPADLWRWHAVEELEHKAVAYDTWLHATRGWSRWKRWNVKRRMALVATRNFIAGRVSETLELMRQDGLTGWRWKWRLARHLLGRPGILRRISPGWVAYFLPGFHPWNHDDRTLIGKFDSEFPDANLRQ